jgi:hypothetical protein
MKITQEKKCFIIKKEKTNQKNNHNLKIYKISIFFNFIHLI